MGLSRDATPSELTGEPIMFVLDASPLIHQLYAVAKDDDPDDIAERFATRVDKVRIQITNEAKSPLICICSFDNGKPTFRNWMMDEYKADREKDPKVQDCFTAVRAIMANAGEWVSVDAPFGFESDDVLASLAAQYPRRVILHTIDKDARQCLVEGRVTICVRSNSDPETFRQKLEWYSEKQFRKDYGFGPERFVDYQCLVGDTADNIKGVPGIGHKTAVALMAKHEGPLDEWEIDKLGLSEKLIGKFEDMIAGEYRVLKRVFGAVTELEVFE